MLGLAPGYDAIVFPGTTTGKNVAPRLAAKLDVMVISEVTAVLGPDTFERPIYAGNAVQTVRSTDATRVLTVPAWGARSKDKTVRVAGYTPG